MPTLCIQERTGKLSKLLLGSMTSNFSWPDIWRSLVWGNGLNMLILLLFPCTKHLLPTLPLFYDLQCMKPTYVLWYMWQWQWWFSPTGSIVLMSKYMPGPSFFLKYSSVILGATGKCGCSWNVLSQLSPTLSARAWKRHGREDFLQLISFKIDREDPSFHLKASGTSIFRSVRPICALPYLISSKSLFPKWIFLLGVPHPPTLQNEGI